MSHHQQPNQPSVVILCNKHQDIVKGICLFNGDCPDRLLCRNCRRCHDTNHLNNYEELEDLLNGPLVNDVLRDFDQILKKVDHQNMSFQRDSQYIINQIDTLFNDIQQQILERLNQTRSVLLDQINKKLQTYIDLKNTVVLQGREVEHTYQTAKTSNFQPHYIIDDLVHVIFKAQNLRNRAVNDPVLNAQAGGGPNISFLSPSDTGNLVQHVKTFLDRLSQDILRSFNSSRERFPQNQPQGPLPGQGPYLGSGPRVGVSRMNVEAPYQPNVRSEFPPEQNTRAQNNYFGNTTPQAGFRTDKPLFTPVNPFPPHQSTSFQPNATPNVKQNVNPPPGTRPTTPFAVNNTQVTNNEFSPFGKNPRDNPPLRQDNPPQPSTSLFSGSTSSLFQPQPNVVVHSHLPETQPSGAYAFIPANTTINNMGNRFQEVTQHMSAEMPLIEPTRSPLPTIQPMVVEEPDHKKNLQSPRRKLQKHTPLKLLEMFQQVNDLEKSKKETPVAQESLSSRKSTTKDYKKSMGKDDSSIDLRRKQSFEINRSRSKSEEYHKKNSDIIEFKNSFLTEHPNIMFGGLAYVASKGQLVTSGTDGWIEIWDLNRLKKLKRFRAHNGDIFKLMYIEEKGLLLSTGVDGAVNIWNYRKDCEFMVAFKKYQSPIFALEYLPELNTILSGGEDEHLRMWKIESSEEVFAMKIASMKIGSIRYIKKIGRVAVGFDTGHIHVIEMTQKTRKLDYRIKAHSGYVLNLVTIEENDLLISGADDGCINIWKVFEKRYESVRQIKELTTAIKSLVVIADKDLIISNHDDKQLRIWKLSTGENLKVCRDKSFGEGMILLRNKNEIATGFDKELKLWTIN